MLMFCWHTGPRFWAVAGLVGVLSSCSAVASATAPNAEVGKAISAQCQACHGNNGVSLDSSIPNLAGQHYVYLVEQMDAFKTKARVSGLMNEFATSLTEEQIEDICAYYASFQLEVKAPPRGKH
jgi:cytochrome c553